jgi:RelA/SpoT family (p)ppGpp synthetase
VLAYDEFNKFLLTYLSSEQCKFVYDAFVVAKRSHQDQFRYSGEPYIIHPLEVAKILASFQLDHETIQAGLLHDVLEDTKTTKEELSLLFGEKVAQLVDGVSKLKQIKFPSRAHEQAENLCKMMFAVAHDIRVLLIKLADRLHNMRTIDSVPNEKKRRKALETLEIYAPISHRLGMNSLKKEFEELGFKALYPYRYAVLSQAHFRFREQRYSMLDEVHSTVIRTMNSYGVLLHQLLICDKSIYSLYRKMQRNQMKFRDIPSLLSFRVIVYSVQDCYRVLGLLHNTFKPVLGRFKDYIAIPKANGYQSLHTTLIVKNNITIEFQIRTLQMHFFSEQGMTSHWIQQSSSHVVDQHQMRAQQWIQNMIELQTNSHTSLEFIEHMKTDLDPDEVYVFDEKAEIWILPKGSTPIDLAYARSAQEARQCVGCHVNRISVPLSTPLQSGQTVQLVFSPQGVPSPGWLTFAITGKARSYIRNWLRNQQYQHSVFLGKRLLNKELQVLNLSLEQPLSALTPAILEKLGVLQLDDLFSDIGLGKRLASSIAHILADIYLATVDHQSPVMPLHINGHEGMVLEYAQCCYPIAGDGVVGVIHAGVGVVVHRENCKVLQSLESHETLLSLAWDTNNDMFFETKIELQLLDKIGGLAIVAGAISGYQINIISASTKVAADPALHDLSFVISVRNRAHLANIIKRLRKIPFVRRIRRA